MSNERTVPGGSNDFYAWGRKVRRRCRRAFTGTGIAFLVLIVVAVLLAAVLYVAFVEHIGFG